jgi:hypothetical protein
MMEYFGQGASSMGIGSVRASQFRQKLIETKARFEVTNCGPGPALLRVRARNEWCDENKDQHGPGAALSPPQLSPRDLEDNSPFSRTRPNRPRPKGVTATVISSGDKVLSHMMGQEYALLTFSWAGYNSAQGTFDWTGHALKLGSAPHAVTGDTLIDSTFIGKLLELSQGVLPLEPRTYPELPDSPSATFDAPEPLR